MACKKMRMHRRELLAAAGGATVCAALRPVSAQGLIPVRIGMALTDGITPVLYGVQTGAFKDAGLDVRLVVGNSGAAQAAAVAGGSLDIAAAALMPLLNAQVKGVPLRVIAGSTLFNPAAPTAAVCVLKASRVVSFGDLSGTTVAIPTLRSLDELGIRVQVDKAGGSSATVRFVETTHSMMVGALEDGRADAASFSEPTLTIAVDSGKLRSLGDPNAAIDPHGFMIAAFFCTPAYFEKNRAVIDRFTRVLYRVTAYTNAHHTETAPLIADYTHMTPELVRKMTRETIATSLDARMIQPAIDVAARYKFIEKWFNAKEMLP